jgi:hypothetical protein
MATTSTVKTTALAALTNAKREFTEIRKDKSGPRGKYASLDSVLGATTPALLKNGLVVVQNIQHVPHDSGSVSVWLETRIFHESGEELPVVSQYPLTTQSDPQKFGAALTYARRYSYCALLGVTADEDDDANSVTGEPARGVQKPQPTRPTNAVAWAEPADLAPITKVLTEAGLESPKRMEWLKDQGFNSPGQIPLSAIPRLLAAAKEFRKVFGKTDIIDAQAGLETIDASVVS